MAKRGTKRYAEVMAKISERDERRRCPDCLETEHHLTSCRQMSFSSGVRRDDPGPTPAGWHSMTLQEELGKIFSGVKTVVEEEPVA